jgi:hypothetical protein
VRIDKTIETIINWYIEQDEINNLNGLECLAIGVCIGAAIGKHLPV